MSVASPTRAEQTTGTLSERQGSGFDNIGVVTDTTTARTVGQSDVGKLIVCSNAGAVTVTIPDSTTAAGKVFAIGDTITVLSTGAAGLTIAKTGSDTLTGTATAATNIARRFTKTAATVWHAYV
jgi:hypothetical protein